MGIDDPTPVLSWRLGAPDGGHRQTAYQLRVDTGTVVWYTGKVVSGQSVNVPYDGPAPTSRQRFSWRVQVWDEQDVVSEWSKDAVWEMGLLAHADWHAHWIADPAAVPRIQDPLVIRFTARQTRFLRLDVTRLGRPLQEGWPDPVSRLQLAELQVFGGGTLLSQRKRVTASEAYTASGVWGPEFLTDGTLHSNADPRGYTSLERHQQDLDSSIWVEVDLGGSAVADEVRLYPRTDTHTPDGGVANFPESFTLQTRNAASDPWTVAFRGTGQAAPEPWRPPPGLPLLARTFTVDKPVTSARLYAVGLGVCELRLNGAKVGDAVLEPAYTDYRKRVVYSTYDVTSAVRTGDNTIGVMLGHGIQDVQGGTGRYTKFTGSLGFMKALVQLEVTHPDGTRTEVVSDGQWRAETGPTTFTNWFGGEDYDARREFPGWDGPGANHQTWRVAQDLGTPTEVLSAQEPPPVRVKETISAATGTEVAPGVWLYDMGRNLAGWPEVTLRGAAGRTAWLTPGEKLANGRVTQSEVGEPVYFRFTPATDEATWHPRFMYYGFRYLEISGLAAAPAPQDVRAHVLRADNVAVGTISTSNSTLNSVYTLVERAVASNMFSVLTDCPHREKLGWLEETHLLYDTVAASFDVASYYRAIARDIRDAQLDNGMVPDIAPEYTVFDGGFRDDPNWGGAMVMVPYKHYRTYGDVGPLRDGYQAMVRYMNYLASRADGHLLDYGLGDWGAADESTPVGLVVSSAYHRFATAMAEISDAVGEDATRYRTLAADIRVAFNAAYFDKAAGRYGSGSQSSNALPLAAGLVPDEHRATVLAALKADIANRGGHLSTGEVGLRALFDVLGEAGDADTVLTMALNATAPSYAAMLASGATTLPEFWDGRGSQNHFMMGAINDWSYRYLAGIRPVEPGYRRFVIAPLIPTSLDQVSASWEGPYGPIHSAWRKTATGVRLSVVVPANTEAEVRLPNENPLVLPGGTHELTSAD
ncbi:family 78 glycoside hydrolase catalytic domain [Actinophytocola oryzae]|uniref:family 78 glycoside hydrolase catalytic domain n=1 Tax=Actinophytocola oryzae TaxID=502181 RepID=UPI001414DF3A|nr:family 78 glycoside hydrolase catalytic domain [Actinophytocola oryzae]